MNEDSTRQKILLAAGPIFAENGYRGATVRDISEAADVNLASINYYFGDKQKLYVETVLAARQTRLEQFPSPQFAPTLPPSMQLREFVHLLLNRLAPGTNAPWQVKLLSREFMSPSEGCRELIEEFIRPVFGILVAIVQKIVDRPLPDHQLQKLGFSIIGQCLHYRCASDIISLMVDDESFDQHYNVAQLAEHITTFSLAALEKVKEITPTETGTTFSA